MTSIPSADQLPADIPIVTLDVRDDLRHGREPFVQIMQAISDLPPGAALCVRATFEPVPLFRVLARRGFAHASAAQAPDDWSAWFWRPAPTALDSAGTPVVEPQAEPRAETGVEAGGRNSDDTGDEDVGETSAADLADTVVELDVRGLQPPEPLTRTLAALDALPPGHTLLHINSRVPQLLFPMLAERGFGCEVDDSAPDRILVRIRRASEMR